MNKEKEGKKINMVPDAMNGATAKVEPSAVRESFSDHLRRKSEARDTDDFQQQLVMNLLEKTCENGFYDTALAIDLRKNVHHFLIEEGVGIEVIKDEKTGKSITLFNWRK